MEKRKTAADSTAGSVTKGLKRMEELKQAFYDVMHKYQKRFGETGVMANLNTWAQKKASLISILRNHPNWNEAEKAIVFRFSEGRGIERDVVDEIAFTMLDIAREEVAPEGYQAFSEAFQAAIGEYSTTLSETALEVVRNRGGIKCATGQKASRIIGKLCRQFGVDGHKRYNAVFAQIADALNPLQMERTAILSVHPCDYLEMSNRDNTWNSCHGLDNGGYQMGTLSYMLDDVSMVLYTVDNDVKDHFYKAPRRSRQMYFFKDNILFQSRMYPSDANDLMDQYRAIVQKAIAICLGVPNLWTLKKERAEVSAHCSSADGSMQYPDYAYYGNISVLKYTALDQVLTIGAPPLCVACGRKLTSRSKTLKCSCADTVVCKECGETVTDENANYVDGYFQCKKCLHICAVCGRATKGEMFAAFDRRGQMVQVCAECHAISMTPCGNCSVQRVCRIIGRTLCPRVAVADMTGGAA